MANVSFFGVLHTYVHRITKSLTFSNCEEITSVMPTLYWIGILQNILFKNCQEMNCLLTLESFHLAMNLPNEINTNMQNYFWL